MTPALSQEELRNKVVIVVDDVLNSGKTLMYSLRPFLYADMRKIRTVLLETVTINATRLRLISLASPLAPHYRNISV